MKTKLVFAFLLSSLFFNAKSQKTESEEYPWRITSVENDVFVFNELYPSTPKGIIYEIDSSAIMPFYSLKEGSGVMKIDRNGAIKWQIEMNASVLSVSHMGKNLLVFTQMYNKKYFYALTATLIDPKNGRKIKEKLLFQESDPSERDFKVLVGPDGQFNNVLIRTTPYEGKKSFKWNKGRELFQQTEKLTIAYLNDKLDVTQIQDKTNFLKDLDFRGCLVNGDHDIFLMGHKDDRFVVQKINAKGELVDKLESIVKTGDDRFNMNLAIAVDEQNPDAVFVSLCAYEHGDRSMYSFLFDFSKKSVVSSLPVIMNKEYGKHLTGATTKNIAKTNLSLEDMKPISVLQHEGQFIVLKTITGLQSTNKGAESFSELIVVSFYDQQMKLLGETAIDKAFFFYWNAGCSFGYHIRDNKLYILAAANTGRETYVNLKATIDCTTRQVTSLDEFPVLGNGRRKFMEGSSTLWFNDHYIISQMTDLGVVVQTSKTVLQKIEY